MCSPARRSVFLAIYGAAVFVYPWTLDLFAFASYQEKWVVLAAALGLLWFAEPRERAAGRRVVRDQRARYRARLTDEGAGYQFVFMPAYVLLALDARREGRGSWRRVATVAGIGALAALALRAVAWHGDYTKDFGLHNVPEQLRSHYIGFWAHWRSLDGLCARPPLPWRVRPPSRPDTAAVFVSFVAVFAQWPGGFLFSVLGFVAAGAFALVVSRTRSEVLIAVAVVGSIVWASAWIWVRTDELYSSLSSIGEFARSAPARALAESGKPVYVSCQEGSYAIASYVSWKQGMPLEVRPQTAVPWTSAKGTAPPPQFRFALADSHLCRRPSTPRSGASSGLRAARRVHAVRAAGDVARKPRANTTGSASTRTASTYT